MNTNPLSKKVLCFGDSNTWGYVPLSKHNRYPSDVRWTGILQNILGLGWEVIEEGLNSRGITKGDNRPGKEGRSAIEYIKPCLDTHDPLDYVVVFLGTNELKAEYNLSAENVGENLLVLIKAIQSQPSQFRDVKPQIIIIVPPTVNEQTEYASKGDKYKGAYDKSVGLKNAYLNIATQTSSLILDIQDSLVTGKDGVHLTPESHKLLATSIAGLLNTVK